MRYLSPEWLAEADRLVNEAEWPVDGPTRRLTIDQVVTGATSWRTVLGPSGRSVVARDQMAGDQGESADLAFSQDLQTATAIARGELSAHHAFLVGRIEFRGRVEDLLAARPALDWLAQILSPLLTSTTW